MKRGTVKANKTDSSFLGFWAPKCLAQAIDKGIAITDLDRSKFLRAAVREKLARLAGSNK